MSSQRRPSAARGATGIAIALLLVSASPGVAQSIPEQLPLPLDPIDARAAGVEPPDAPRLPAPVGAGMVGPGPGFQLAGIRLDGATALDEATLAPLWAGLIGREVTLSVLEEVAGAITARYRAEGFVLSQAVIPAQMVEDGIVAIVVVEGFVDRLSVEGEPPPARVFAERRFGPVASARPLDLGTLERSVLIARDTLGGTVETLIEPAAETFGAADITVLLAPDPIAGFVAADNRGSRLYGDVSAAAGVTLYGLLGLTEQIEIIVAGDPLGGDIGFLGTTVSVPIAALDGTPLDGARLAMGAEVSTATPDLAAAGSPSGLRVTLDEWTVGGQLTVPFRRSRSESVFGRLRLDWRDSRNGTTFAGERRISTDRLATLEAGVSWDRADRTGGVTILDLDLRRGLGGSIGETGAAAPSEGFTRGRLRLARLQRLGEGGWSVYGELIGQAAGGVMPAAERFSLGGATVGRGFAPGNTAGDAGLGGRLELRRRIAWEGGAAELYGFGDYGEVRNRRAAARDLATEETIGSVGFGARIDVNERVTLTPEVVRQVSGRAVDTTRSGLETRAFVGLVARF